MIRSLLDPNHEKPLLDEKPFNSAQDSSVQTNERRPPVLGIVIAFIVLFWGAIALGVVFWPR